MRIFLDANVLFSAAKSDGATRKFLSLLHNAGHALCADAYVTEEARRNLAAKAPPGIAVLDSLLAGMHLSPAMQRDAVLEASLPLPAKDQPVLAAAIRQRCDALLTGDRTHFGALFGQTIHGVAVHSPKSLADALFG